MATFAKILLSGSTDGRNIKITATSTPGTTLHTGSATATTYDEVFLYAANSDTAPHKLTVEFGGTTAPDDLVEVTIPAEAGATLVIPGWLIKGNATPLVVKAFADTANVITVNGYVNQKTA